MKKLLLIVFVLVQLVCQAEYDSTYVLSITQKYAIPENVVNGDYVGIWKKTYTWSPVGTISFSIEQNYNSAFSINSSTGLITVSNATPINGQVSLQDMLINLIIRTTDSGKGYELDTARIWVKENAFCKFIDYGSGDTGDGTLTAPYNDFSDITVTAGYGYFIKRGNTPADKIYNISGFQASAAHPTIISAYSTGNNPMFNGSGLGSADGLFYFLDTLLGEPSPSAYCYIFNIDIKNYPSCALRIASKSNRFSVYNSYYEGNCRVVWSGQADVYYYGSPADTLTNWGHEMINLESYHCKSAILKTDASGLNAYNIKAAVNNPDGYNFRFAISYYSKLSHFLFIGGVRSLQARYSDVVITDGIITGATEAGMFLVTDATWNGKPNDLKIKNVLFKDNSYGIYAYNATINGTIIEDCRFESNTNDGIYFLNGGFDRIIRRCSFINNGSDGIHLNRSSQTSTNLNINYNEFYGNTGYGINATGASCATGLKVYNNTVDGNITLSGTSGSVVRNNFFYALTEGSTPTTSHNLDIDAISTGNYFTNYAGHNYSLKSTASLAINLGYNVSLTSDIIGTSVPQGGTPDIGAYEYVSGGVTVSIAATDAAAGEAATPNTGTFTVTRTGATTAALTVNFSAPNGTATLTTDYTLSPSGSVTIAIGSSTATVTVTPVDDTAIESSETVIRTLTTGTGYTVGSPSAATVTIADNDLPTVTITATDAAAAEATPSTATGTFTVTRTGLTTAALTVNFSAATGTATLTTDYTLSPSGSVTIAIGSSTATVTVTPVNDATAEGDETVIRTLTTGTGYTVGTPSAATVTIANRALAHWKFEQNGTDASGNGRTATLYGSPTYVTGADGYGINLNTSSTQYAASNVAIDLGSVFTITGWYKFTGTTQRILVANSSWTPNGFVLYMYTPSGQLRFKTGNGSSTLEATSTTGYHTDNTWKHIAVVVNKTAGTCTLYVNGVNRTSVSAIRTDFGTNTVIRMGRTTDDQAKLYGNLDDVRLYGSLLSATDISQIYTLLKSAKIPTLVPDKAARDISIYPVPFKDLLTIQNTEGIKWIEMLNINGQTIFTKNNEGSSTMKIDTKSLKSGVYFLRLFDNIGGASTYKVVK